MSVHKWLVGFVLAMLMVATLGINAVLFSSRSFQYNLEQGSPETYGLINLERLLEVDGQIAQITAETAEPRGELLQLRSQIETLDQSIFDTEARINQARTSIAGAIAEVEAGANIANAQSAAADLGASGLNSRIVALAGRSGLAPDAQERVASLRGEVAALGELETLLADQDSERTALVQQERASGGVVAESDRRIFALQQSVVPNYEDYGRVKNEANALMNASPLGWGAALAQWHPASLSIVLVLLMGALGATLYLFPAYLNRAEPVTFAEIAVRTIFGMCVALAFYVVANASISGFALSAGVDDAGASTALNPFAVSFVGIVAGLMAEDIAKWIQDRGKGIFTQGGASRPAVAPPPANEPSFAGVNPHGGPNAP